MATVFATVTTPGPPGPTGPPGYSPVYIVAAGPPSTGVGSDHDMYINSTTGDVYGPKVGGLWGPIVCNIKGPTGATGAVGPPGYSPRYIVAAGPPTSQGNNGDMYIDSVTSDVYGPKSSGAWGGIVCNIKGLQGPPGVAYNPRGAWSAAVTYAQGDEVTYSNQLFISLQATNLNNVPTTSPTWWQPVGSGGAQTPWLSDIDGASFKLKNAGRVAIGNSGLVIPDSSTNDLRLLVGSATIINQTSQVNLIGNSVLGGFAIGSVGFANYNLGTTEKRVAAINGGIDLVGGHSGVLDFFVWSSATAQLRMRMNSVGHVGINNDLTVLPGPSNQQHFVVGGSSATLSRITSASIAAVNATVGVFSFANYGISASEKRIAQVQGFTDGSLDSGAIGFTTFEAGIGSEKMRISANGRVGIGTTTPAFKLDVVGGRSAFTAGGESYAAGFMYQAGSPVFWQGSDLNGDMIFSEAGGVERMRIKATGFVGIGTNGPAHKLHIVNGNFYMQDATGDNAFFLFLTDANGVGFTARNNAYSVVKNMNFQAGGGNVGIGTTVPLTKLAVFADGGNPATADTARQITIGESSNNPAYRLAFGYYNDGGVAYKGVIQASNGAFNGALLLNPLGGVVGIGTTAPNVDFHVYRSGTYAQIKVESDANGETGYVIKDAVREYKIGINVAGTGGGRFGIWNTTLGKLALSSDDIAVCSHMPLGVGKTAPAFTLDVAGDINTSGGVFRVNGVPISTGGSPQTPWATDIDAASHVLSNCFRLGGPGGVSTLYTLGQQADSSMPVNTLQFYCSSVNLFVRWKDASGNMRQAVLTG